MTVQLFNKSNLRFSEKIARLYAYLKTNKNHAKN